MESSFWSILGILVFLSGGILMGSLGVEGLRRGLFAYGKRTHVWNGPGIIWASLLFGLVFFAVSLVAFHSFSFSFFLVAIALGVGAGALYLYRLELRAQWLEAMVSFLYGVQGFLAVGMSLPQAFGLLSSDLPWWMGRALRRRLRGFHEGRCFIDALEDFSERLPFPELRAWFRVIGMAHEKGLSLSPFFSRMLPGLSEDIDSYRTVKRTEVAALIQALSASALPWGLFGFYAWAEAEALSAFLQDPLSTFVFLGVGVAQVLGLLGVKCFCRY